MDRVSAVALGDAGLAAIAILLGGFEAWLYIHRPKHREHLWLSLLCVATAIHAALLVVHYDAAPPLAVKLLKGELATIIVICHCGPLFAMDRVKQSMALPRWFFLLSGLIWLVLVPTPWVVPDQLVQRHYWLLDGPFLRRVDTPLSVLGSVYGLILVLATAWWLWRHQHDREQEARHFAVGVAGWFVFALHSSLFGALGWPMPMSTFEYGFAFFALALVASDARRYMRMLASSERDFRAVVASSPEAAAIVESGVIRQANPVLVDTLGFADATQVEGRELAAIVSAEDAPTVEALLAQRGASPATRARFMGAGDLEVELELVALPVGHDGQDASVLLARNVSERKRLTARTMEMDRIISMGTLAAGIGHEINNPLAYVLLNLEEAKRALATNGQRSSDGDLVRSIDESLDGVLRIRTIAEGLARFARAEREQEPLLLSQVIRTAVNITANQIRLRARLELELDPDVRVRANETRLVQVFVNLLVNAAQAIGDGDVEDNFVRVESRVTEGGAVECDVSDSGAGIPPDEIHRVFDAFYTTKARGEGTGLGLGICRDSLQQVGGTITVESTSGDGSTIRVVLPKCDEPLARLERLSSHPPPPRRLRVLVVDDEAQLLRSLERLLGRWADVVGAPGADDALALLADREPFDLILSDLMMPGRSGMDLYSAAIERDPELASRFVFMTGGTFTKEAQDFRSRIESKAEFLDKPIGVQELRAVLDRFEQRRP